MFKSLIKDTAPFALRCLIVAVLVVVFFALVPGTRYTTVLSSGEKQLGTTWCIRDGQHSSEGAVVEHESLQMQCVVDTEDPHKRLIWRRF